MYSFLIIDSKIILIEYIVLSSIPKISISNNHTVVKNSWGKSGIFARWILYSNCNLWLNQGAHKNLLYCKHEWLITKAWLSFFVLVFRIIKHYINAHTYLHTTIILVARWWYYFLTLETRYKVDKYQHLQALV